MNASRFGELFSNSSNPIRLRCVPNAPETASRFGGTFCYHDGTMVLSKEELIGSLQHEVHILVHLAGKIDRAKLGYKPTEKQRTTVELLQYLDIMGPRLVPAIKDGKLDNEAWGQAQKAAAARDFEALVKSLAGQSEFYRKELGSWTDDDFRAEIDMFGQRASRGVHVVRLVLGGHAAYRTQLFCYLKSCGGTELSTWNLWGGVDAPA